jgi:hypothetical protein
MKLGTHEILWVRVAWARAGVATTPDIVGERRKTLQIGMGKHLRAAATLTENREH